MKKDLVKYCKYNGLKFDEDIFHNTIIGCMDKDELPDNYEVSVNNTESLIEYNDIQRLLRNKFGEEMLELFNKHISGYSVRELEQLYNCKQLTYKLNKMKQYCKENY